MKHTILSLMLAFLAGLSTLSAANYSGTCGNDLIWTLNTNDSILIIYGSGAMDDYSSSSSAPWYSYRSKIKGVNLPNELTSIGNYAFNDCSNLASITFNENLESIGSYSFYKCKALKSIYLPNSITSIGDKAFASSLATTITIEKNTPPSIGKNVFPSGTMIDNSSGLPEIVEIRTTIYVPCELVQIYQTQWKDYSSRITNIPFPYTIGILLKSQGTLLDSQNDVSVACDNGFKLSAPTYTGYHFTQWSDGNTDNPRSVDVASNTVFTAEYEINYYSLHLSCDTSKGSVSPLEGTYAHSSDVVISATPKQGFKFQRWSDADTNNPRTLTLYKDVELSAIFVAEDPIKAISVNGELIPIADTMFVYDEHESTYIPQIETLTKSETANAEVVRLDNTDYGWNAVVHIKESNVILKEYTLFIFSNSNKQKVRITLTGEDRTSFSLSSNTDAFSSVVGNTRHETKYNTFSSYTGYKLGNKPSHIGLLFPLGTLQQGDIVSVLLTQESDIGEGELFFYSDEGITPIKTIQGVYKPGLYSFVLGNNAPQLRSIYLYRNDMEMNPYVAYLEISRIHSAFTYSISCNEQQGQVNIEKNIGIIKAEAIPNKGYHFTQWNDGNTDNPRTIILTQDTVITAEFSANKYDISVTCDTTQGSIAGASGEFDYMSNLTYRAIPNNGYQFSIWSDGVTDNPRTIVLTQDTVIRALYNINYYKVDFVDWDNSILKSDSVEYLFAAVPPTDPVREGYTFIGWDIEVPSVTQDTVIRALYNINYYKVDFVDWDNSILKSDSVEYLSAAVPPANPTREGYTFISWDKEVSAVTQDTVIQALYSINRYTISVTCDSLQGTIEGVNGEFDYMSNLIYRAVANNGYTFSQWSDGITDNPRTITLTQDTTLTAEFAEDYILAAGTCGEYLTWTLTRDSILTIEGYGNMTSHPWRNYNLYIKIVSLPDGLTTICKEAFRNCVNLTSVTIPNSVTTIVQHSFQGCTGLTSVILGYSVTTIEKNVFRDCTSLVSITIPNSVTSIGNDVFTGCTSLMSIYVPCGELDRFNTMLKNDSRVQYLPLPYNITANAVNGTIEFPGCYDDSIQITAIPNVGYTFTQWSDGNTDNPRTIILTQDTTFTAEFSEFSIDGFIYNFDTENITAELIGVAKATESQTMIVIPDTVVYNGIKYIVTAIGDNSLNRCRQATHISFPNSATTIGQEACRNCSALTAITLGEGITSIGVSAFEGCTSLNSVTMRNNIISIENKAFRDCRSLTSIDIPNSVTSIGDYTFYGCSSLTSVTIPPSVTSIGDRTFANCTGIRTIVWNAKSCTFVSSGPFYHIASQITSFIIGDSVEHIPARLCYGCENLWEITIPNSVTKIGDEAFRRCYKLKSINIPNSVLEIGESAFCECSTLEEVIIGTKVVKLGKSVFSKSASIKRVQWNAINYRQKKPNEDSNCFPFYASRDSITSFIFGDSVEYIPAYLMKDYSAIHSLVIPASVAEIGEYAFTNDSVWEITCLAEAPPTMMTNSAVEGINKSSCILYVPYASIYVYRNATGWREFVNIQAIGAEEVEEPEDAIVITPSNTTANIIWALISNAASYELVIRDMNGNIICTLTFNALGQLTGIAFAPNRNREGQQTQAAGFQFTVSGLNSGTTYEYALTAFDENDNIIETRTGTFTTTNDVSTDIEQMNEDALNMPQKIMRDGNVYILRGDKVFTVHGQEVK